MARNLDIHDFRAVRRVLDPDDFALTDGEPDGLPTDLIDEEAWDEIMTLPGDVAIRTSSHQGSRISLLNKLTSEWITNLPDSGIAASAMLEIYDNMQSSVFSQLHGYYKEAISILRNALETGIMAAQCVLGGREMKPKWGKWENGEEEVHFSAVCNELADPSKIQKLENLVTGASGAGLFVGKAVGNSDSWSRTLYRRVCQFSHARGNTTNAAMWQSNGPIYSADGFKASYYTFLEVHAFCLILAKLMEPTLNRGKTARLVLQPDNVNDYIGELHRNTCTLYCSRLWSRVSRKHQK